MTKETHSLRNFAALQSGGATHRNSSLLRTWLLIQNEQNLEMTLPQKNGSGIKTSSSKSWILVSFPQVKCLLLHCKAKPAWLKRRIHYLTLQHYNPGELLQKIPPYMYFERDFWYKMSKFWKWHYLRKMALESKRLHQNHESWCHFPR